MTPTIPDTRAALKAVERLASFAASTNAGGWQTEDVRTLTTFLADPTVRARLLAEPPVRVAIARALMKARGTPWEGSFEEKEWAFADADAILSLWPAHPTPEPAIDNGWRGITHERALAEQRERGESNAWRAGYLADMGAPSEFPPARADLHKDFARGNRDRWAETPPPNPPLGADGPAATTGGPPSDNTAPPGGGQESRGPTSIADVRVQRLETALKAEGHAYEDALGREDEWAAKYDEAAAELNRLSARAQIMEGVLDRALASERRLHDVGEGFLVRAESAEAALAVARATIGRYEAALRFYDTADNWLLGPGRESTPVEIDGGQIARTALEGGE